MTAASLKLRFNAQAPAAAAYGHAPAAAALLDVAADRAAMTWQVIDTRTLSRDTVAIPTAEEGPFK